MKKILKIVAAVVGVLALGVFGWIQTGTNVRQLKEASSLKANGKAERTREANALDYSIAATIAAPAQIIWGILTDGPGYTRWNSTVVKLEGAIAAGSTIQLVAKIAPERTFPLKVSEFEAPKRMVWEDGGKAFMGVRTFTLTPNADGTTTFAMSETLSGRMLSMIEPSLPDFAPEFDAWVVDLKKVAEAQAAALAPAPAAAPAPAP